MGNPLLTLCQFVYLTPCRLHLCSGSAQDTCILCRHPLLGLERKLCCRWDDALAEAHQCTTCPRQDLWFVSTTGDSSQAQHYSFVDRVEGCESISLSKNCLREWCSPPSRNSQRFTSSTNDGQQIPGQNLAKVSLLFPLSPKQSQYDQALAPSSLHRAGFGEISHKDEKNTLGQLSKSNRTSCVSWSVHSGSKLLSTLQFDSFSFMLSKLVKSVASCTTSSRCLQWIRIETFHGCRS
jgi:hypothetical protein